jgi:4-hydroxybenzoate polyprenyltransferase
MMKKIWAPIDRLLAFVDRNKGISVGSSIVIILAATFLRTFFENYSNPEPFGGFTAWFVIVNFLMYYTGVLVLLTVFVSLITKQKSSAIYSYLVLLFPVIITAPLFDLLFSWGSGACMAYLGDHGLFLIKDFFTFFGPTHLCGITLGIRLEVLLVLVGVGLLVYRLTKNFWKTAGAVIGSYGIIFANLAASGIILTLAKGFGPTNINIFFGTMFHQSLVPTLHSYITTTNPLIQNYVTSAIFMGRLSWILTLVGIICVFYLENKLAFKAYFKDIRIARILYYTLLAVFGMSIAYRIGAYTAIPHTLVDVFGFIIFFASIALNFTFAATTNDIVDQPIDALSNTHRPLVTGALSAESYRSIALVLGGMITTGSLLINYHVFVCTLVFHVCFYLYSFPPLRLKRHFLPGGILLAIAGVATSMSGYAFLSIDPGFDSFPLKLATALFVFLFLIVHIRDFKDIEGDTHAGIQTLPVVFGEKKARIIIGVLVLVVGLLAATHLYRFFEFFGLAVGAISAAFCVVMVSHKVDERIPFLLFYILAVLAIIFI